MNKSEQAIMYGKQDYYFLQANTVGAYLGLLFHSALLIYFFAIGVDELGFFNIFSVSAFAINILLLKKFKNAIIAFVISATEVIAHACFGVYLLGMDSGLGLFIWLLALLLLLGSQFKLSKTIFIVVCFALIYFGLLVWSLLFDPNIANFSKELLNLTNQVSILSCAVVAISITLYFKKIVVNKENVILREIHHRVKNNLQILGSIANLQKFAADDDKCTDLVNKLKARIQTMSILHQQIYLGKDLADVSFREFTRDVVQMHNHNSGFVEVNLEVEQVYFNLDTAIPLGMLFSEVVKNCFEHGFVKSGKGQIHIDLSSQGDNFTLRIENNGDQFPENVEFGSNESVGFEIVESLAEQLDGKVRYENTVNGVLFELQFSEKQFRKTI